VLIAFAENLWLVFLCILVLNCTCVTPTIHQFSPSNLELETSILKDLLNCKLSELPYKEVNVVSTSVIDIIALLTLMQGQVTGYPYQVPCESVG
jgi:hypothetical protein